MVNTAIAVKIIASVFFSSKSVATISTASENPTIKIVEGNPSRYMTIKKEKYTSARPVSFCAIVISAGVTTSAVAISCERVRTNSVSGLERYLANARQTQILQNSAG